MSRSKRIVRCSRIALAFGLVTLLAGCGAVVTAGIAGGVFALGGGKKGSGGATPTTVNSAAVVGDTSTGTVQFIFTISNASSSDARVEVRFSVTPPNGTEDDATQAFPTRALPAPAGLATASPSATSVANDASLATSPGGTAYTFLWNTSQDLGAFLYDNSVRLQLLIDGQVAFTVSPFTVDNTLAPQVVSVTLPPLTNGATEYADAFQGGRGIPVTVTVADANAENVALTVLYSTDGGGSFPATNIAAGNLVDPATATIVPINSVTTTQSGKAYTFVFASASNGLGTTTDQQGLALQFTAATTKRGTARATAVFAVDNVAFSAAPGTPTGNAISDIVDFGYLLTEGAGQPLDVAIAYSTDGGVTFSPCTELKQPPSQGTQNLITSSNGAGHSFVWNAYQDLLVGKDIPALADAILQITPIRRSTQVAAGPFRSRPFTIDQRLIYTIFSRQAGVTDGVAAGTAQLTAPTGVAVLAGNVYLADTATNRVRVVPISGGTIETFFGGGEDTSDGALATDFALLAPTDIAADPVPPGALFVCGSVDTGFSGGPVGRLFRVDGSTPIVTTLFDGGGASTPYAVCFEPKTQTVYFATFANNVQIFSVPPDGSTAAKFIVGQGVGGSNTTNDTAFATAILDTDGLAANFNIYPGLIFFTEENSRRLRALNVDNVAHAFGAVSVPAQSVKTLSQNAFNAPYGISIEGKNALDVTDRQADTIFRVDEALTVKGICGSQSHGFNGDAFTIATQAKLLEPTRLCGDLLGPDLLHPSTGFFFADTGNVRIRQVEPSNVAPIATFVHTFAGTTRDMGDNLPCATAQLDHPASLLALNGSVIVADTFVGRVRAITTSSTIIGTLAGNGTSGDTGDGGLSINATVGGPIGLVAGVNSAIYFSQFNECVIRKIVPGSNGPVVLPVAGTPNAPGAPQDGQLAASQPLLFPRALAFSGNCIVVSAWDSSDNPSLLFAINDTSTTQVCTGVTVPAGQVKLIAGGGSNAPPFVAPGSPNAIGCQLGGIESVTADRAGALYIADVTSACVYKLDTSGQIIVVAGTPDSGGYSGDGGPANGAQLFKPDGLGVEEPLERVLYILDAGDDAVRAVNVSGAAITVHGVPINPGEIQTIAGGNFTGFSGDGGPATSAQLDLSDVTLGSNIAAIDSTSGPILVFPDIGNSRIRTVDNFGTIRTFAGGGPLDGDATALQAAKTPENCNATRPTALAVQSDGTYYLMDLGRVRRVNPDDAVQKRLAGTAQPLSGLDGVSLNTAFGYVETSSPKSDVILDQNGPRALVHHVINGVPVLVIADTLGSRVRVMNLDAAASVTPNGMAPIPPQTIATIPFSAPLSQPEGVAIVSSGVLLVSNTGANAIVAANFTSASSVTIRGPSSGGPPTLLLAPGVYDPANVIEDLDAPQNMAYDSSVDMVVVISEGGATFGYSAAPYALSLSPNNGQTLDRWGSTIPIGGPPTLLNGFFFPTEPRGCALDPSTFDLYYTDRTNQTVERIHADNSGAELVAGNGAAGFKGDGGVAKQAELRNPIGVGVDSRGSIYILDGGNFKVRRCRNFP